jgi:hypothetical protein
MKDAVETTVQPEMMASRRARAAVGIVVVALGSLSVQDYFDQYSLVFTAVHIVLIGLALALVLLSPAAGEAAPGPAATRRSRASALAAALAWTGLCAGMSYAPSLHSKVVVGAVVIAGSILSAVLLVLRRGPLAVAALPAIASYLLMLASPLLYWEHAWYPVHDRLEQIGIGACYAAVVVPALFRMRPALALAIYIVAGSFLRGLAIYQWEMDPAHRDMIPLIHNGALAFLDGHNPYRIYYCDHDLPLTYLPLLWLSYLPVVAAGLEPRIMSVLLCAASTVLLYLWKGRRRGDDDLFLYIAGVWFFQAEVIWVAVFTESPPYWLFAFLLLWAVVRRRKGAAALALGLMLATRHFALLFAPFALVWFLLREDGDRARPLDAGFLIYPAASAAVACLFIAPFVVGSPLSFFFGTFHWLTSFGPTHRGWWDVAVSLSPLFYSAHLEKMLLPLQGAIYAAVFLGFLAAAARKKFSPSWVRRNVWVFAAAAYLIFLVFNSLVWRYLHLMGFALVLYAAATRHLQEAGGAPGGWTEGLFAWLRAAARRRAAAWAVLAVVVVGGSTVILKGAWGFIHRQDIVESAARISKTVRPGDLLVDYTYFNAWPVLEGTPFPAATLEPMIKHSLRLRSQFPPQFRRVLIVTSGNHFVYPADAPDLAAYMTVSSKKRVGRLTMIVLENPLAGAVVGQLTQSFGWVQAVSLTIKGRLYKAEKAGEEAFKFPPLDPRYAIKPGKMPIQMGDRPCILASPPRASTLRIVLSIPMRARLWLQTAVSDYALWPGLGSVDVGIEGIGPARTISSPDEQGWYVWPVGLTDADGRLVLTVSSERKKRRFFCFDLVATEAAP